EDSNYEVVITLEGLKITLQNNVEELEKQVILLKSTLAHIRSDVSDKDELIESLCLIQKSSKESLDMSSKFNQMVEDMLNQTINSEDYAFESKVFNVYGSETNINVSILNP